MVLIARKYTQMNKKITDALKPKLTDHIIREDKDTWYVVSFESYNEQSELFPNRDPQDYHCQAIIKPHAKARMLVNQSSGAGMTPEQYAAQRHAEGYCETYMPYIQDED